MHPTESRPQLQKVLVSSVLLGILIFFIWPYLWAIPTGIDDSMITARHSENLARGNGLVFSQGEKVLGTTTPLWALISHWIFYIPLNSTGHGVFLCLLGGVFALAAIVIWSRKNFPTSLPLSCVMAFLLCVFPSTGEAFSMGMETGFLIFLTVLLWNSLLFTPEKEIHWIKIAALAQAMLLTRLDSLFLLLSISMSYLWVFRERSRKPFFKALGAITAVTLGWLIFCKVHYGHFLPHSMVAKSGFSSSLGETVSQLISQWVPKGAELLRLGFPWPLRFRSILQILYAASVLGCLFLPFLNWRNLSKRERFQLLSALLYLGSYSAFFAMGKAGIYPWYSHLPCFVWFGSSLPIMLREFHKTHFRVVLVTLSGLALMIQFLVFLGLYQRGSTHLSNLQLGEYLRNAPCDSVMLEPIGFLGFHSKCRKVMDLAGLVSPDVLVYRRQGNPGWFFEAVVKKKPQFIVLRKGEVERNLGFNVGILFSSEQQREAWKKLYQEVSDELPWQKEYSLYRLVPQG